MFIFPFIICLSLSADAISITSNHARGQRSSSGYFFTYINNVTAHGPQLGSLRADMLTAHFVQKEETTCDYLLARQVTLRHKEHILSADNAVLNSKTKRLTARGNVKIKSGSQIGKTKELGTQQARVTDTMTTAKTAVIDLNTNQLHLDHGTHTHAFTSACS